MSPPWRGGGKPGNLAAIFEGGFQAREPEAPEPPDVAFGAALRAAGLLVRHVVGDGQIHRVATEGSKPGRRPGWYVLYLDEPAAGAYGDYQADTSATWCAVDREQMTAAARAEYEQRMQRAERLRVETRDAERSLAARQALELVEGSDPASDDHPYLASKGVRSYGLRVDGDGRLLVPICDESGRVVSVERIDGSGAKRFMSGGRKRGCYFMIGAPGQALYICEGYSTAASVHESTGEAVVVAFDAGNLEPVARLMRELHPQAQIIIAGDDDRANERNVGRERAEAAAAAVGGRALFPRMNGEENVDWNDLHQTEGASAVREQLEQRPLLELRPASRWAGEPVRPREWLLEEWIPMRQTTGLYGDGGTGKSLLAQQLATCVAVGRSFMGLPTRRGPVVYLACEDDEDELHRRQDAINEWLGSDYAELGELHLISRAGGDNILMEFDARGHGTLTPLWYAMRDAVDQIRPALLIVDTAADTFSGNENARPQVRQYLQRGLTSLAIEHDCAALLAAHPSIAGMASGEGSGGSTAWNNTLRSRLYFERLGDHMPSARVLSKKKANYAAKGGELTVHWARGVFWPEGNHSEQRSREAVAQGVFLQGLWLLTHERGQAVTTNERGNYAPRLISHLAVATTARLGVKPLALAMDELLASRDIVVETHKGDRQRLVLTAQGEARRRGTGEKESERR